MFNEILVLCVGNICRSPIVEGLLANYVKNKKISTSIKSAGISAVVNAPAHNHSIEIMQEKGIDISAHRAKQLTIPMLQNADLVLVMEDWQQKEIARIFPSAYGKVYKVGKWGSFNVPDPMGKSKDFFLEAYHLMEKGVQDWQKKIWGENG